jgi:hypothetical protein
MITNEKLSYFLRRFDQVSNYYRYNPFTRWVGASELAVCLPFGTNSRPTQRLSFRRRLTREFLAQ